MKTIFSSLLIVNILFAVALYYQSNQQDRKPDLPVVHPEKIVLLPALASCMEWGVFSEPNLHLAEIAISNLKLQKPHKQISATPLILYWVYTPPFESQQGVEREINKLRNMGIISYRVQEEGPWLNAITFGEFRDKSAAQDLLSQLNASGITHAVIRQRKIEQKKFLFFETDTHKIAELQNLTTQFTDSKLVHTTCERL